MIHICISATNILYGPNKGVLHKFCNKNLKTKYIECRATDLRE